MTTDAEYTAIRKLRKKWKKYGSVWNMPYEELYGKKKKVKKRV